MMGEWQKNKELVRTVESAFKLIIKITKVCEHWNRQEEACLYTPAECELSKNICSISLKAAPLIPAY